MADDDRTRTSRRQALGLLAGTAAGFAEAASARPLAREEPSTVARPIRSRHA